MFNVLFQNKNVCVCIRNTFRLHIESYVSSLSQIHNSSKTLYKSDRCIQFI
jgi:hypothetical protein